MWIFTTATQQMPGSAPMRRISARCSATPTGSDRLPEDVVFQTKPALALQQIRQAQADGVPLGVALADPAYGNNHGFRAGITELGLSYAVGIGPTTTVWRPGEAPPPAPGFRRGRRAARRRRREAAHRPVAVKALALELSSDAWQQVGWREGTNAALTSSRRAWQALLGAFCAFSRPAARA